jgi:hypothetical protein
VTGMRIVKSPRKAKAKPVDVAKILSELQMELEQIENEIRSLKRRLGSAGNREGDPTKAGSDTRKNLLSNLD